MSLHRHFHIFAERQQLDKSLHLTRASFYFLTATFIPLTSEVGFFHSSDVWLCETRICGCSGKTEVVRLREQQLAVPLWGQNSAEWPPKGPLGLIPAALWEESLQYEWHFQERFLCHSQMCLYMCVSFFAYLAFSILCIFVQGRVFRKIRADCWLALQPAGALLWKTCIPQILLKLHSAKWFVIPGWKALLLL